MIEKDKKMKVSRPWNQQNDETRVGFQISSDKLPIERMTKLTGEDLVIFRVPGGCGNVVMSEMTCGSNGRVFYKG